MHGNQINQTFEASDYPSQYLGIELMPIEPYRLEPQFTGSSGIIERMVTDIPTFSGRLARLLQCMLENFWIGLGSPHLLRDHQIREELTDPCHFQFRFLMIGKAIGNDGKRSDITQLFQRRLNIGGTNANIDGNYCSTLQSARPPDLH